MLIGAGLIVAAMVSTAGRAAMPEPPLRFSPDQAAETDGALTATERRELESRLLDRDRLDRTVWASERQAQQYEAPFVELWDRLRGSKRPIETAAGFALDAITLPVPGPGRPLDDGVTLVASAAIAATPLTAAEWRARLTSWRKTGWTLIQTEWHHAEFHRETIPPWSAVNCNLHLIAPDGSPHEFRGRLRVTWHPPATPDGPPTVATVDATALVHVFRRKAPAFRVLQDVIFERSEDRGSTMLHAWDLDGDGRSDLVLPGINVRFRNLGGSRFRQEPFLSHPVFPDPCGILADFDGDGRPDYLCTAGIPQRLLLFRGGPKGSFPDAPVPATDDPLDLRAGSVITVGDVDGDGFADIWIGQYRNPYLGGTFPSPYYDAKDGYPCFLLKGDGHGRFKDMSGAAGFDAKRNRRNYGAVLFDIFGQGRLDLVTVNDFAGVDVWRNLGGGKFADATATAVDDPMNFGMGIAVDDFAQDGSLGFYVSGMGSTTMRRLAGMGLRPAEGMDVTLSRTRMGYGNRMYLRESPGVYREPAWNALVSRSGWSWGTVGFDPDLDGDRDLYIMNGFISGRTTWDYCTRFWCHDVYTPPETGPRIARHLLAVSTADINRGEISWNGYEKKRFFMRTGATEYVEAGWPLGLAFEEDCRNLVADDFDGDGRPDLALLYEARAPSGNPGAGTFGLRILRNELPAAKRHWIGVRVKATGPVLPFGATVEVRTASRTMIGIVLTGDSWRSQQAPVRHFGLGTDARIESVTVRWPGGAVTTLDHPAADRYRDVAPPAR